MKRDALVLERNLLSLEEVQPQAAAILRSSARSEELVHIKTRHGLHSIAARDRTLHSRYDPVREAMRQYHSSVSEDTATVIVFGLGAGFLPVTVLRQLPDTTVIAVERSWETVRTILEWIDLAEMFSEGRLRLAVTPEGLVEQLRSVHLPVLRERVAFISLNAWVERRANRAHFETCLQYGREFLNRETRDSATMRSFGKRWVVHTVHNSHTMPRDQNWNTTLERLQSVIAGTTVTVAAAGPSLEAFLASPAPFPVIAVDTALPALRRRGIIPEAVVVLDPQPWSLLHLRRGVPERTVLFLDAGVAPGAALRASRSGVVWFFGNHPLHQLLFSRGAPLLMLPSPPESVTEAAVLISRGLGAAEINLVGADGGYPRAVTYAPGTYQYALADRNASRLTPRAHFFSRSAYSGTTPTTNDTDTKPFFSNPALADRQIRIRAVADWKSPMAKPDTPWPVPRTDDNGINRFDPEQFWASHAHQLQTIMDALDEIEPASGIPVPKLMDILGPHGIAHLPAIAPDRGSWSSVDILAHIRTRIESLRGFILVENDRYSYTG